MAKLQAVKPFRKCKHKKELKYWSALCGPLRPTSMPKRASGVLVNGRVLVVSHVCANRLAQKQAHTCRPDATHVLKRASLKPRSRNRCAPLHQSGRNAQVHAHHPHACPSIRSYAHIVRRWGNSSSGSNNGNGGGGGSDSGRPSTSSPGSWLWGGSSQQGATGCVGVGVEVG